MKINGNSAIWIAIIVSIIVSFTSILFAIVNRQTVQESKDIKVDIIKLEKNLTGMNGRIYLLEGHYAVINEKLDVQKADMKEIKTDVREIKDRLVNIK